MDIKSLAFAITSLSIAGVSSAADFDAKSFHDAKCTMCHGTDVYTRDNRRVKNAEALRVQVARCDANLGTGLFPEDLDALAGHLNDNYYHFSK